MQPNADASRTASGTGRAFRGKLRHAVPGAPALNRNRRSVPYRAPHCSAFDTGAATDLDPCLGFACKCVQMPAGVCPAGPGGAMDVTRTNAVMPTATAPITEKTVCQVSDGMRCLTMPWVA